jgi:hypothetical protein
MNLYHLFDNLEGMLRKLTLKLKRINCGSFDKKNGLLGEMISNFRIGLLHSTITNRSLK